MTIASYAYYDSDKQVVRFDCIRFFNTLKWIGLRVWGLVGCSFAICFLGATFLFSSVLSAGSKWEVLEGCRLVSSSKNDGDSFVVRHEGTSYTFRLYFVDTPETGLFYPERVAEQAEYFQTEVDVMLRMGEKSEDFSRRFLSGRFTVYTEWRDAMGHSTRYAALLYNDKGESLVEALVENGYARIKGFRPGSAWPGGKSSASYCRELESLERKAKRERLGAWRKSDADLDSPEPQMPVQLPELIDDGGALLDINHASKEALVNLPGIGPVYADRIIESRPFFSVKELIKIHGIGPVTYQEIEPLVTTTLPEEYADTAYFYYQSPVSWANREIGLRVSALRPLEVESPDGFEVFTAETGCSDLDGGTIRLYLPEARTQDALSYFERSAEPARLSVYFFEYQDEWVAVLRAR